MNSSPELMSAARSPSSSSETRERVSEWKLKWLSVGEVIVVERVEVEKCERGCSSAADTAERRRRGAGRRRERFSSGSCGRGLDVSRAVWMLRVAGESRPEGGGARGVKMPFSFRDMRLSWLAKLSSSSTSSAISSGMKMVVEGMYEVLSWTTKCRSGDGSRERDALKDWGEGERV